MDQAWGVVGADTHKDSITFAMIDSTGADVALRSFQVTSEGVAEIIAWLRHSNVKVTRVGIEGSAGWGLPVSKALVAAGFDVREVNPARHRIGGDGAAARRPTVRPPSQSLAKCSQTQACRRRQQRSRCRPPTRRYPLWQNAAGP